MRKRELLLGIAGAVLAGLGALILSGLSVKWAMALIVGILLVGIMLVVQNAYRMLLFALALIVPFHIGTGLPPFLTISHHAGPWSTLDIQFIDVIVLALILYRLVRWVTQRVEFRFYSFSTIPAIAWIAACALSAIFTSEVTASLIALGEMVKLLLLYLVVANSIEDKADINWLVSGLLLGAFTEGVLGPYQWITGHPLGLPFLGEPAIILGGRSLGTIGNSNGYGMWLAAVLPLALTLLFLGIRGFYKALVASVLCIGFLGLLFSLSRGAWLGFVVASIVVLVFATRRRRENLQIALVGGGSIVLILLVLVISQRGIIVARLTDPAAQESALSRLTLNEGAISMIRDYPVLGVGPNNYSLLMPKYDSYDYANQRKIVIVHNVFLLVAAEAGVLGLAAFLWFLASVLIRAAGLTAPVRDDISWLVGVGAIAALTALVVHGMADYDLIANITIFRVLWLFAAMVASLSAVARARREAKNQLPNG